MRRAFVSSMLYIPKGEISPSVIAELKAELTLTIDRSLTDPTGGSGDPDIVVIKNYDTSVKGYFGVPRQFGFERFPDIKYEDRTVTGADVRKFYKGLKPLTPKTDQQRDYFREIANICKSEKVTDFISVAKTGSGKTAAIINAALESGKAVLVLVHTNRLKEQWLGNVSLKQGLRYFFGTEFVENYVGVVQQDRCEFKGKAVCVGLIHSVARREYPAEFYRHFGVIVLDELQKHTAPHFAQALMKFPQRVRGGQTATLREDVLAKIAYWHYGPVSVQSQQSVLKPKIFMCKLPQKIDKRKISLFNKATVLNSLADMEWRNEVLAHLIYHRGFKRGRQVLAISDRVHQLQWMEKRLRQLGVPYAKVGLYTGRVYTGQWKAIAYCTDSDGNKIRYDVGPEESNGFFPNKYIARKAIQKFIQANPEYTVYDQKIEEDFYTLEDAWYRRLEERCSIFLTTYGVFEAGNDIARLDMGVELTPRADERQPLGRILRDYPGKPQPEWYSICDEIRLHDNGFGDMLMTDFVTQSVTRKRYFRRGDVEIATIPDITRKFQSMLALSNGAG